MTRRKQNKPVRKTTSGTHDVQKLVVDKNTERYFLFLQNLYANEVEKYEKSKIFPFPFYVEEKSLKKINEEVLTLMKNLDGDILVEFSSKTRFQDYTTLRIASFDTYLEKAGDKKDPEHSVLSWKKFNVDEHGEVCSGQVSISFVTEKRMHTQDLPPGEFNHAFIEIHVSGSKLEWVEHSFNDLCPFLDSTKLSGIYKPLWFFRNKMFINISSLVFGWIGFFIGLDFASDIISKDKKISRMDVLNKILEVDNIGDKLDLFAQQLLNPPRSMWWAPIATMGIGAIGYGIIYFGGMNLLPRLTPNSHIAIGLANIRAKKYMNAFKFIVFTLIIAGIILPLLLKLIFG